MIYIQILQLYFNFNLFNLGLFIKHVLIGAKTSDLINSDKDFEVFPILFSSEVVTYLPQLMCDSRRPFRQPLRFKHRWFKPQSLLKTMLKKTLALCDHWTTHHINQLNWVRFLSKKFHTNKSNCLAHCHRGYSLWTRLSWNNVKFEA